MSASAASRPPRRGDPTRPGGQGRRAPEKKTGKIALIRQGYKQLVNTVVRPPRVAYRLSDLGQPRKKVAGAAAERPLRGGGFVGSLQQAYRGDAAATRRGFAAVFGRRIAATRPRRGGFSQQSSGGVSRRRRGRDANIKRAGSTTRCRSAEAAAAGWRKRRCARGHFAGGSASRYRSAEAAATGWRKRRRAGDTLEREDFEVVSSRGEALRCSRWRPSKPTDRHVLYLHSNSSCRLAAVRSPLLATAASVGATLVAFDFAGCGVSDGDHVTLGLDERDQVAKVPPPSGTLDETRSVSLFSCGVGTRASFQHRRSESARPRYRTALAGRRANFGRFALCEDRRLGTVHGRRVRAAVRTEVPAAGA